MNDWLIFEILINVFQACIIVYFLNKQLVSKKTHRIADCICVILIFCLLTVYSFIDISIETDSIIFIVPLLYSFIVFSDRWHVVVFWNIITILIFTVVVNLTSSFYLGILNIGWDQLQKTDSERIGFIISTNILTLTIMLFIIHTGRKRGNDKLSWESSAILLSLNIVCVVAIELLFAMGKNDLVSKKFTIICFCLFIISLLSIALYEIMIKNAHIQRQYELRINRLELMNKHINEIRSVYEDIAVFRHDIKHHIQIIKQMWSNGDTASIQDHIKALDMKSGDFQPFSTGNVAIDALLTAKTSIIRHKKITFRFQGYSLVELPISETDLCTLLGNVLDNALEGIERVVDQRDAYISLSFRRTWDMLFIICENTYNPNTVQQKKGLLISSKRAGSHGLGIRSIKETVERNGGTYYFDAGKDVFRITTILPYGVQEGDT